MIAQAWSSGTKPLQTHEMSWDDRFLSWFSGLGLPAMERQHRLGGFSYHYFETRFTTPDGRPCSTHGRSQNRKVAAVKAVAEFAERKFMTEFFMHDPAARDFSKGFRTSNGWAVHQDRVSAEQAAFHEALERHLLLKSYSSEGWRGFRFVHEVQSEDMTIYFLQARLTAGPYTAGLVIARSKHYPGASFGYCLGLSSEIQTSRFWESALCEAVDKILLLEGCSIDLSLDPGSWLLAEVKHYLETPFDVADLTRLRGELVESPQPAPSILHFDLGARWGLDFPLHAAFAHSGGLIPLCSPKTLSEEERAQLQKVLHANGLSRMPERHPIL